MLLCMRTTIIIDDDLMRQAKELAVKTHRTFKSVVEDALREALNRTSPQSRSKRVKLPVSNRRPGLCPGVDLDRWADLLDVMEK